MKNILFFGGGNIAQALISGLLLNGMSNKNVFFVDRNPANQKKLKSLKVTESNTKKSLKKNSDGPKTLGYHFNYALMLAVVSLALSALALGSLYFIFFVEIKDLKSSKDILLKDLISKANLIHEKRYSVKNDFEKLLNQNLSELGMNNSEIKIDLSKTGSILVDIFLSLYLFECLLEY